MFLKVQVRPMLTLIGDCSLRILWKCRIFQDDPNSFRQSCFLTNSVEGLKAAPKADACEHLLCGTAFIGKTKKLFDYLR